MASVQAVKYRSIGVTWATKTALRCDSSPRYLKIKISMSMLISHYRAPVVSITGLIVGFSTGSLGARL